MILRHSKFLIVTKVFGYLYTENKKCKNCCTSCKICAINAKKKKHQNFFQSDNNDTQWFVIKVKQRKKRKRNHKIYKRREIRLERGWASRGMLTPLPSLLSTYLSMVVYGQRPKFVAKCPSLNSIEGTAMGNVFLDSHWLSDDVVLVTDVLATYLQ